MTQHQPDSPRTTARPQRRRRLLAAFAAVGLVALAACGGDDSDDEGGLSADETTAAEASGATRTVEVEMADNEFSPAQVEVAAGETVRFVFTNEGEVTHDAVIGDEAAQMEHEDEMRAAEGEGEGQGQGDGEGEGDGMGAMGHGGSGDAGDEGAITVEPGSTGEVMHTFSAGDDVLIGCHEPGHYDAGMKLTIDVADA